MGPSVYETTQELLVEAAHTAVLTAADGVAWEDSEAAGLALRTAGALYSLLGAHAVDRQGRCRWCRRPRWPGRRGPTCTVYAKAYHWLHQPLDVLIAHLADLGIDLPEPGPAEPDPDATQEMTPIVSRRRAAPPTAAIPPPPAVTTDPSPTGRPDTDHGGAGVDPDLPRPHRAPPQEDPPIGPHQGVLVVGGPTPCWP
jgi:hypothetical protein